MIMYCVALCYGETDCCIGMESGHLKQGILSVIIMHTVVWFTSALVWKVDS